MLQIVNLKIGTDNLLFLSYGTKKHEKLARSYNRQIMSGVPRELQPYAGKWKYEGVQEYRDSPQHIHRLYFKELTQ